MTWHYVAGMVAVFGLGFRLGVAFERVRVQTWFNTISRAGRRKR